MIVDCAAYANGARVEVERSPEAVTSWCRRPDAFVWLGLRMPTEVELDEWCDALDLDEVSSAELLRPHLRPVLGLEGPTLQLVLRTARYDDAQEAISLGEMTVLVGPKAVISIRHGQASPLSTLRARLEQDPERLQEGPMGILAAIVGRVIEDYGPALDGFEADVIETEREVFSDTRRQPIRRLYQLKREVRQMLVAIESLEEPLARLIRSPRPGTSDEVMRDLAEAADQLDRTVGRAQSLSNLLDTALTATLAQISVQQNEDMRRISAWVAMAAVPTLVAGIYGMNFQHFPELEWSYGYPLVLGAMAAIAGLMFRAFRRGGWF